MKKITLFLLTLFLAASGLLFAQTGCPAIVITGATELCQGSSTIITASNGYYFILSNSTTASSITIKPPASITYTLDVSNGVCSKDTSFTIIVDTMPNVKFICDTSICKNDSTIISIKPEYGYTYLWSTGSTSDSILVKEAVPGFYRYTVNVTNGNCSKDSQQVTVHVNNCIQGVMDYSDPIGIRISPNPASSQLSVTMDAALNKDAELSITDMIGRQVYSAVLYSNQSQFYIDVSALTPAVYFLKLQTGKGILVKKFVKE